MGKTDRRYLLEEWRKKNQLVPVKRYHEIEKRYHKKKYMMPHEDALRKLLRRVMDDNIGVREIGINLREPGIAEYDLVVVTEDDEIICFEVKTTRNGRKYAKKQVNKFRRRMGNNGTHGFTYIGEEDLLEKIF